MKKKVLFIALSFLASAGTIYSMETQEDEDSFDAYVIFSTDKYDGRHIGTFLKGCLCSGFNRQNIVMIMEGDSVTVGQVLWYKDVRVQDDSQGVTASDLFSEVKELKGLIRRTLAYLEKGICIEEADESEGQNVITLFKTWDELNNVRKESK